MKLVVLVLEMAAYAYGDSRTGASSKTGIKKSARSRTGTRTKTGSASSRNGLFLIRGLTYGSITIQSRLFLKNIENFV